MLQQEMRCLLFEHLVILVQHSAGGIDHPDMIVSVDTLRGAGTPLQSYEADVHVIVVLARIVAAR